ncbi:MAG TPA: hypothetical protein VKZ78_03160 [Sphingobacteriaceae bacterium]|nr:hypothetical protein [Sphingobacteriaceae bacterium]
MILPERIFQLTDDNYQDLCLEIFQFQARNCRLYSTFLDRLGVNPVKVKEVDSIPFLPIEFFKSHQIVSKQGAPDIIFSSSGTTGTQQSQHFVMDLSLYESSFNKAFELFYGAPEEWVILALLPSYQERDGSSLVYMVDHLIERSQNSESNSKSGYFLYDHDHLYQTLQHLKQRKQKTLLIGVTYALLDFTEKFSIREFPELVVMETGGMKGRRKEMIREEVHKLLSAAFDLEKIHSEYGMTELLSQSYSGGDGLFSCPPWMKIKIRDTNDPLTLIGQGKTGGINVIDLANLYSCSFIATQDLGRIHKTGQFEVLGRFDHSDIRGCNLLVD